MNRRVAYDAAIIFASWLSGVAPLHAAGCVYPQKPALPNGSTASREEMLAAQQTVKQYGADIETYVRCVDAATPTTADDSLSDAQKQALAKQIELSAEKKASALSEQGDVAARFNQELQIFKARQPDSGGALDRPDGRKSLPPSLESSQPTLPYGMPVGNQRIR